MSLMLARDIPLCLFGKVKIKAKKEVGYVGHHIVVRLLILWLMAQNVTLATDGLMPQIGSYLSAKVA